MIDVLHWERKLSKSKPSLYRAVKMYFTQDRNALISLFIITAYLGFFTIGLFAGELYNNIITESVSQVAAQITLILVFIGGSSIIYNGIRKHHPLVITSVVSLMGAYMAKALSLFEPPVQSVLFDMSVLFVLMVLYCTSMRNGDT